MSLPRIKICGITSESAASAATEAGADALGFIFYSPSPRHLEIERAAAIRQSLPPFITPVAVMVNPEAGYVAEIVNKVQVDLLQFHGEEEDEFCTSFGRPYIKAIRISKTVDPAIEENRYPHSCGVLLDTHIANVYGGSGKSFDWEQAHYKGSKPVILAGGLNPQNVQQALTISCPYGVDVSTGVETCGKKDIQKMIDFCKAVRNYA